MARQSATVRLFLAFLVAGCGGAAPTAIGTPPASSSGAPVSHSPTATNAATPSPSVAVSVPATVASTPPATPSVGLPVDLGWRQLAAPNGPGPREDQTWTVDPVARIAYMFGGRSAGTALDELWRYDLTMDSWTRLEPPAPRPGARFGHVAAWDPSVGLLIWSGQQSPDRFYDDTWIYDAIANSWRQLPSEGDVPAARYGSCGGFSPDGKFWISHGFTMESGRFHDTRVYDLFAGRWYDRTPPAGLPVDRCLHDCFWSPTGQLVLYGGQTTGVKALGDLWTFDPLGDHWTELQSPPPPPRQLYALATLGGAAYFFGGGDIDGGYLSDLWRLDVAGFEWSELSPGGPLPAARSGATVVADAARSRMLMFGGKDASGEFGDLWQLGGS